MTKYNKEYWGLLDIDVSFFFQKKRKLQEKLNFCKADANSDFQDNDFNILYNLAGEISNGFQMPRKITDNNAAQKLKEMI